MTEIDQELPQGPRTRRRRNDSAAAFWSVIVCAIASLACTNSKAELGTSPTPISECQEYQTALARCMETSQPLSLASADTLVGKTEAERDAMRNLCRLNMQRLKTACR